VKIIEIDDAPIFSYIHKIILNKSPTTMIHKNRMDEESFKETLKSQQYISI